MASTNSLRALGAAASAARFNFSSTSYDPKPDVVQSEGS
jgi:hypothetical protein